MKIIKLPFIKVLNLIVVILLLIVTQGCMQMSETIEDESVGMNGSFEVTSAGLPVNWLLYTPKTVKEGDFDIIIDRQEFVEGSQSLSFDVRACSSSGGWQSPGFSQQFEVNPGCRYALSFWVKNQGCELTVNCGAVGPTTGEMKTILQTSSTIDEWKKFEYIVNVPEEYKDIRFELNITKPGKMWIDDIHLEEL